MPRTGAQGTIISYGSRFGGFALYVKDGKVYYDSNFGGYRHSIIGSSTRLPVGKATVAFAYIPPSRPTAGDPLARFEGRGRLYVNGSEVGSGNLWSLPLAYFGALTVGRSYDSPVSAAIHGRFPFTGKIETVVVDAP